MFGTQELLIVLVIVVVIFGAKRLPELGSGIGQAIKNFKKATSEPDEIEVTPPPPTEISASAPEASNSVETPAKDAEKIETKPKA